MSMKKSNDTIWNRTRDLPACSAVPQPTAPLRAPMKYLYILLHITLEKCQLMHGNDDIKHVTDINSFHLNFY
jgi:hypothetical protein